MDDPNISYLFAGGGTGMSQWGDNEKGELKTETVEGIEGIFPAFVGTDAAPEGKAGAEVGQEIKKMDEAGGQGLKAKEGVVVVPVAQSAISVMVSLPVGCEVRVLSKPKVKNSKLFQEWTEKRSAPVNWEALIEGASIKNCSGAPATLYGRAAASGTTAGFKRFFASLASPEESKKEWERATETTAKAMSNELATWPEGTEPEEKGVSGMWMGGRLKTGSQLAEATYETPGSIGYADWADATQAKFTTIPVKHTVDGKEYYSFVVEVSNGPFGKGEYASPASGTESNCSEAIYAPAPKIEGNADWSKVRQENPEGRGVNDYPICTLMYDLAWHEYSQVRQGGFWPYRGVDVNTVYNYLNYVVHSTGGQAELGNEQYGALPKEERILAETALEESPGGEGAVINWEH